MIYSRFESIAKSYTGCICSESSGVPLVIKITMFFISFVTVCYISDVCVARTRYTRSGAVSEPPSTAREASVISLCNLAQAGAAEWIWLVFWTYLVNVDIHNMLS